MKKININFKVDPEVKDLLNSLVVLKTLYDNSKSSQVDVLKEALLLLFRKYKKGLQNENK